VANGEGSQLEFKRKAADPVKIMREVVAFANARGGILLVGVNDDGIITGLKDAAGEAHVLEMAMEKHCKPSVEYRLEYIKLNARKNVLAIHVAESKEKPVFLIYNFYRQSGRAYLRVADRSVQSSKELRKILRARTQEKESAFIYGDPEHKLMQLLALEERTDVLRFAEFAKITKEKASEVLVKLTIANVTEIHPGERMDQYSIKHKVE